MNFYTSIADLYDEIFPYKPPQKAFVESFKHHGLESVLLDIGCGTGSLALNLAKSYGTVIGLDPDKEMLDKANFKGIEFKFENRDYLEDMGSWVFLQKGMGDIREEFAENSFDTVLCFGNTLVHLPDLEQVKTFLIDSYEILKSGASLMIQIINYDRIIGQKLTGLPTIETDNLTFERFYHYGDKPTSVDFHTILTVEETGEKIENRIPLLAIKPQQLRELMLEAGYKDLEEFGNFKKENFDDNSQAFIISGKK